MIRAVGVNEKQSICVCVCVCMSMLLSYCTVLYCTYHDQDVLVSASFDVVLHTHDVLVGDTVGMFHVVGVLQIYVYVANDIVRKITTATFEPTLQIATVSQHRTATFQTLHGFYVPTLCRNLSNAMLFV